MVSSHLSLAHSNVFIIAFQCCIVVIAHVQKATNFFLTWFCQFDQEYGDNTKLSHGKDMCIVMPMRCNVFGTISS